MRKSNTKRIFLTLGLSVLTPLILGFTTYAYNVEKTPGLNVEPVKFAIVSYEEALTEEKTEEITEEKFIYSEQIPMAREHQEYLYDLCKKNEIDFMIALAVISLESNFNNNLISSTSDYGYMQINKVNHKYLSSTLGTENKPLDARINMKWGTHMLGDLYKTWRDEGISDEINEGEVFSELDKYVFSSYNRGMGGFRKHGMANKYIELLEDRYGKLQMIAIS